MRLKLLITLLLTMVAYPVFALSTSDAAHLLIRTGFGATPEAVADLRELERADAVQRLIESAKTGLQVSPPEWALQEKLVPNYPLTAPREVKRKENRAVVDQHREWLFELQSWLATQALHSEHPLTERMTFFWQNHFVSAWNKVRQSQLMFDQYMLLRTNALGRFSDMLHGIVRDPAMLIYLDNRQNKKGSPNENLAREILELFSLGEGNYTESDIKEAARALSGWTVNRKADFQIRTKHHDAGVKTIFCESGRFDADDLVQIILKQDATAKYVVTKLWKEFVSPSPEQKEVDRLATLFRDSGYQIKPLLVDMFTMSAFWAEENRGTLIKSPLQIVLGTLKTLDIPVASEQLIVRATNSMGQSLFKPPNVKGWPGGQHWIDSTSLLARTVFIGRVIRAQEMTKPTMNQMSKKKHAKGNSPRLHFNPELSIEELQQILLCCEPTMKTPTTGNRRMKVRSMLFDPVYQLY